jgi:hypothetical protein
MIRAGSVVVVAAFDEVPEHEFLVQEVFEDHVTGVALTGPLAGQYGEPELGVIVRELTNPSKVKETKQNLEKPSELGQRPQKEGL